MISVYACDAGERRGKIRLHLKASALIKDPQTRRMALGEDKEETGRGETLKGMRANRRRQISGGEGGQRHEEEMPTAARMKIQKTRRKSGEIRLAKGGAE